MPRFLRLGNEMIHVPSLSSVTIRTNCFGRPLITLSYHTTKSVLHLRYSNWDSCQKDFNQLKNALNEVEALLNKIPLTEPDLQEFNTIVEKKMIEIKESIDTMDILVKEGIKSTETSISPT
jgi:hypothetical protein